MLPAAYALAFLSTSVHVPPQAQTLRQPVRWPLEPFARQLGAVHFPSGEAAFDDAIAGVEVLPSGAAIVVGSTYGSLGEAHAGQSSTTDIFVARFGVLGNLEWIRQVGAVTGPTIPALNGTPLGPGGDATEYDFASDVAVAPDGSIFVTGWTSSSLGETRALNSSDLFVAKFDPAGTLLWLRQIGAQTAPTIPPEPGATQWGDASGSESPASMVVHPSGDLLVGGTTTSSLSEDVYPSFGGDFFVARFDANGMPRWVRQLSQISGPTIGWTSGVGNRGNGCDSIALHPSGNIVLAGMSWFLSGTLYVESPLVFRFDDAGHPLDWDSINACARIDGIAIHPSSGQILLGGSTFTPSYDQPIPRDAFAACYDANLSLLWAVRADASATSHLGLIDLGQDEHVGAISLDRAGNLVLAGMTQGSLNEPNGGSWKFDIFTARIRRTDGFVVSMNQIGQTTATALNFNANNDESVGSNGFAIGPAGTLYLGGATSSRFAEQRGGLSDALLLRLDPDGRLR